MNLNWLKRVEFGANQVINQIDKLQQSNQPIEILQFPPIQIPIRQPIRELVHNCHEQRARVAAGGDRQPKQGGGGAPHALWRLVVEELEMPDRHERLRDPMEAVLRH